MFSNCPAMNALGSPATEALARRIAPCIPSASGVRSTSAPSARMIITFSCEKFSGTNSFTLYPRFTPISASPIPVLPAVASTMVPPGASFPSCSALRMIPMAARSFTLPPGFRYSSLAKMSADPGGASFFICSIGVSPTSFEISSLRRRQERVVDVATLQSKERQPPASIAILLARAPRSLHCRSRVGALPTHVGRRAVRRRHRLSQQTQVHRQLRPVMSCMQDASPEDPDPFPAGIKERNNCPPPVFIAFCHESEPRQGQLQHPLLEVLDRKPLRQDLFR